MAGVVRASLRVRALRFHAGQVVALFALSALAIAACTFGPLYGRAVEAAQLQSTLQQSSLVSQGLSVRAGLEHTSTDGLLPSGRFASFYRPPVTSTELAVSFTAGETIAGTSLVARPGLCQHLRFATGRCPTAPGEVVASTSSAAVLHLVVGSQVPIKGVGLSRPAEQPLRPLKLKVVGLYVPFDPDDAFWFDHPYSSSAGVSTATSAEGDGVTADTLFARTGFESDLAPLLPPAARASIVYAADLPLDTARVHLDDIAVLRRGIAALAAKDEAASHGSVVHTALPSLFDDADHGRRQARTVIPVFAAELAFLVLVVVAIVMVSAADRRQMDFGLARMRGHSRRRAAGIFDRPVGGLVLASVVPGVVLAWLVCALTARWWLAGRSVPELRWPVVAAVVAVTLVELVVVILVARRAAGRPVQELLRRVPRQVSKRGVGLVEAAVGAAAIGGTAVVLSGDKHNALAIVTPGLIALVVGLALSRAVGVIAHRAGRRAFWQGRLGIGLAALQIARRSGSRGVVTLLCVAAALVVSAADQWSVAARNRSVRAEVDAGAPVVLTAQAASASVLRDAVLAADPAGRYATPVVLQQPPNAEPVMAVEPAAFARVAGWGWAADRPPELSSRLNPSRPAAIALRGSVVQLHLTGISLTRRRAAFVARTRGPVSLLLRLIQTDGTPLAVPVGPIPEGTNLTANLRAPVACTGGCVLSQISLLRATADTDTITLGATIARLNAGSPDALRPVALGSASTWASSTPDSPGVDSSTQSIDVAAAHGGLRLVAVNGGVAATVQHLAIPIAIPAVATQGATPPTDQLGYLSDSNIDGLIASYRPVGSLPLVPGAGGPALLVDLDVAAVTATPQLIDSTPQVWLSKDDPGREHTLIAALARHGVTIVSRDTTAAHRAAFAASAPAWAMQVALATALLAVVIAGLVILLTSGTSRRGRASDAAAMRLVGIRRATLTGAATIEQVAVVLVAVLVGVAAGLVGAHVALPAIPFFVSDASVPKVQLPIPWMAVAVSAVVTLAVLVAIAVLAGAEQLRRLGTDRRGEGER